MMAAQLRRDAARIRSQRGPGHSRQILPGARHLRIRLLVRRPGGQPRIQLARVLGRPAGILAAHQPFGRRLMRKRIGRKRGGAAVIRSGIAIVVLVQAGRIGGGPMQLLHLRNRSIVHPDLAVGDGTRQMLDHHAPRDLHARGDLVLRQAVETAQHEGLALALGQFLQGLAARQPLLMRRRASDTRPRRSSWPARRRRPRRRKRSAGAGPPGARGTRRPRRSGRSCAGRRLARRWRPARDRPPPI